MQLARSNSIKELTGKRYSGHCGGAATLKKHGIEHFQAIGKMGGRPKAKILRKEEKAPSQLFKKMLRGRV